MSKFTRFATTSQTLSITAMEEASRRGLQEADLQDLFLALVLNDKPAGQVLRDQGVTIASARTAVEEYQREQIASLGIAMDMPPTGRIVSHETAGYDWSKRATELLRRATPKKDGDYATAVLRELLDEPSGLIIELLRRLGTTREIVTTSLDRIDPAISPAPAEAGRRRGTASHATQTFVPAPVDDVWRLLTDPRRVPEWDASLDSVQVDDPDSSEVGTGMTWIGRACTEHADGKPLKVREKYRRRTVGLEELVHPRRVVWQAGYPDAPRARPFVTAFELTPTRGGTQLTITTTWQRSRGFRAAIGLLLTPLERFLLWIRLSTISAAISRAFRQP